MEATAERQIAPSEVFASRLREIRAARGVSQAELARRMTEGGRPLSKAALLRIENGKRGLSLDEALALAQLLYVAPAHMLSPPDDSYVWLTNNLGVRGGEMRNWLLFGDPLLATPTGQRVRLRLQLVQEIEVYAQALLDARNGSDQDGVLRAADAIKVAIEQHNAEMGRVAEREKTETPGVIEVR